MAPAGVMLCWPDTATSAALKEERGGDGESERGRGRERKREREMEREGGEWGAGGER